jgi:uncharacterized membrane protein
VSNAVSIMKSVTYRLLGSSVTFVISYVMTGSFVVSGAISVAEFTIKPFTYYLHERAWESVIRRDKSSKERLSYYEKRARWGD